MNKQKNSKALVLVIISLVLTVAAVALFAIAPVYEDMIGGWSFIYEGNMWGMYQYGYAPLGLFYNIGFGLRSLFKFVIWFTETTGVINARAILADVILVIFIVLLIIWIVAIGKNRKSKHAAALVLTTVFFAISFITFITLFSALDYVYAGQYTYLFDSVLLNTAISMLSFVMVSAATGISGLCCALFIISEIIGIVDGFKKPQQEQNKSIQKPQSVPVQPRPVQPAGTRPVQPMYNQPTPTSNNGQTGRVGSNNVGRKPPAR